MDSALFPIPSKKALKKLGYLRDQRGIVNRFLTEEGWKKHVEKTKNFITKSLKEKEFKTISILGSGWFLDIPINFLLSKFDKIYCYDVHHPKQVMHKYRKEKRVIFIESDLTGGIIERLLRAEKLKIEEIPIIQPNISSDVVVSLNLLSQLDSLLFEYSGIHPEEEQQIRKQVQKNHLKFLSAYPYLLITDYEEVYFDDNGNKIGNTPTVYVNIPQGKKTMKWIWKFDMHKTYKNDCKTELNVVAINNL